MIKTKRLVSMVYKKLCQVYGHTTLNVPNVV